MLHSKRHQRLLLQFFYFLQDSWNCATMRSYPASRLRFFSIWMRRVMSFKFRFILCLFSGGLRMRDEADCVCCVKPALSSVMGNAVYRFGNFLAIFVSFWQTCKLRQKLAKDGQKQWKTYCTGFRQVLEICDTLARDKS